MENDTNIFVSALILAILLAASMAMIGAATWVAAYSWTHGRQTAEHSQAVRRRRLQRRQEQESRTVRRPEDGSEKASKTRRQRKDSGEINTAKPTQDPASTGR